MKSISGRLGSPYAIQDPPEVRCVNLQRLPVPRDGVHPGAGAASQIFLHLGVTILRISAHFLGERHPALGVHACLLETLSFQSNQI